MQTDLLKKSFSKYISLTPGEEEAIIAAFQEKKIRRKQFLLQHGDKNSKTYFVLSGIVRMYTIDKNGFEHIIQFAPAGWWIADIQSVIKQAPATLFIDAIEDSEVLSIKQEEQQLLFEKYPKLERFFRMLSENSLASYQQRFANSLSLSAKERYIDFCKLYPELIQQLPQKHTASYIGVTPEFLSKMLSSK